MVSPEEAANARAINEVLTGLPMQDRLSALVCSVLIDQPRALPAVAHLIACVGVMARCMSPSQRLAICWAMLEEIEKIGAKWN